MKKLPAWGPAFNNPQIGRSLTQAELTNSPKTLASVIRGVQKQRPSIFELAPKLERLPVKTLVVMSDGDAPVVECSQFMVEHIPQAALEVIPARSHWTHLEAPEQFLEAVDPEVVVISVGADNDFGHPCAEVLERLELALSEVEGSAPVYRTDEQGVIEVITDGVQMWVETER